jgi:hypothetical protein
MFTQLTNVDDVDQILLNSEYAAYVNVDNFRNISKTFSEP